MDDQISGAGLVLVAGLFNAAFALPMRYNRIWKWENTWLVFCVFSLIVFPWLLVSLLVLSDIIDRHNVYLGHATSNPD